MTGPEWGLPDPNEQPTELRGRSARDPSGGQPSSGPFPAPGGYPVSGEYPATGAYPPGYGPVDSGGGTGRTLVTAIIAASVVVIVLCLAAGVYLVFHKSSPAGTGQAAIGPPSVQTVTAAPSAQQGATVTATAAARSPGVPPADATVCSQTAASGLYQHSAVNEVTTCPFAENVRAAYNAAGQPGTVVADSPVTDQTYTMTCVYVDATTTLVSCTGGNDADVYLY